MNTWLLVFILSWYVTFMFVFVYSASRAPNPTYNRKASFPDFWDVVFCSYLLLNFQFQDLSVFLLYVRCTAIDPADPGSLLDADKISKHNSQIDADLQGYILNATVFFSRDFQFLNFW